MTLPTPGLGDMERKPAHCDTHGDYEAVLLTIGEPRWTGCPDCAREAVTTIDNAYSRDEEDARRRVKGEALARVAGIPPRHAHSRLDNYELRGTRSQAKAHRMIDEYARGHALLEGASLILTGTNGSGKTHLACAAVRHLALERNLPARYITAPSLFLRIRASYSTREETERDILDDLAAPTLLVIDEIGLGAGTDHEMRLLSDVLCRRYDDMRATILCTNLPAASLREWLGDRAVDRLRQTASVVVFDWPSYRGEL